MTRPAFALAGLLFAIPAAVNAACTVSVTGVAFGAYNALLGAPTNATGTIQMSCTGGSGGGGYTVALSTGAGGSYGARRLSSGGSTLSYQLYQDSAHTLIWGDGTGGSVIFTGMDNIPSTGGADNFAIYGQLPARQAVAPGVYADSIIVTITF